MPWFDLPLAELHKHRTETKEPPDLTGWWAQRLSEARAAARPPGLTSYQPGSRFWPFQWIEGGWLLALSVLLIGATVWLVRRRAAHDSADRHDRWRTRRSGRAYVPGERGDVLIGVDVHLVSPRLDDGEACPVAVTVHDVRALLAGSVMGDDRHVRGGRIGTA